MNGSSLLAVLLVGVLLPVVPVVEGQQGRVATSYVRIAVEPDFQYRDDQDVVIPVQVRAVREGVPQQDRVSIEVRTEDGDLMSIPGGQDWLRAGVEPFPNVAWVNLGKLPVGLYRIVVHASAGELHREWLTEFDVTYAPQRYEAALLEAGGREGRFVFEAHDAAHHMTITMYRGSPSGGHIIEQVTTNKTVLDVPYIPGELVSIQVVDENGWKNAENRRVEWGSGRTYYDDWVWSPDYQIIENYKQHSWREATISGLILLGVIAAWFIARRRSA